jgi:flagellar M-ring protein FliF|tara:strand:+ start:2826 stop:4529 length:1704 start_codon:yes stop_codon:yes gene_type:complete
VNQIVENLKDLGPKRLALLGGIGLAITAAIFIGARTILAPTYVPVYSQLSPGTASQMMQTLEQAGLTVDLSRNGDTISVAETDIARARMALADAGLPGEGVPGWEIFDNMSGMGMNSFMQKVNRLRALEGELARSIQTISGIKAARVHLVLPERAAFSRSRAEASGSVIVRSQANASMTRSQAQAIQALVASAVADLEAQNVTVLSASGETILAKDEGGSSDFSLQGQRSMIEEQLAQKVESILNARVGPGNARVRVSVDLTTEREVRVSRTFDPAQQVARSIETRVRNSNETDPAAATVDVANNIPDELRDDAGGGAGQSTRSENDEIINYEIGSVQSELVREPGDIERISVAVLVNGSYGTLPDGSEGYIERSPEEMQRLSQLVSTAIGFDQGRGDQVQVDSLQFLDFDSEFSSPAGRGLGAVLADNAMTILRSLFALALVAIIMVLGARPLRMVLDATLPQPALAGAGADAGLLDGPEQNNAPKALTGGTQNETPPNRLPTPAGVQTGAVLGPMDEMPRDMVQLASVEGAVQHSQLRAVAELAEDNTEDALRVLGQWLSEGDDL